MSDDFLKLDVGGKLRRLREDNGLSLADLAKRAALATESAGFGSCDEEVLGRARFGNDGFFNTAWFAACP